MGKSSALVNSDETMPGTTIYLGFMIQAKAAVPPSVTTNLEQPSSLEVLHN